MLQTNTASLPPARSLTLRREVTWPATAKDQPPHNPGSPLAKGSSPRQGRSRGEINRRGQMAGVSCATGEDSGSDSLAPVTWYGQNVDFRSGPVRSSRSWFIGQASEPGRHLAAGLIRKLFTLLKPRTAELPSVPVVVHVFLSFFLSFCLMSSDAKEHIIIGDNL